VRAIARLPSRTFAALRAVRLSGPGWVGVAMVLVALGVAIFGPYFAPHRPDEIFGTAFDEPSRTHLLGLDFVGRDVLSRFLWGGRTAIVIALVGTTLGFAIGGCIGLVSAYRRGWLDEVLGRVTDLALAFPALIFALLLLAAFGTSLTLVVIAIAVTTAPGVARIARAAALEVVDLPYVEAARARGERPAYVMSVEIFPNVRQPLLVDYGLRITASILLVAALSFLGLGLQPPAADWGLMIGENRIALTVQPWPVVVPVLAIAFVTIGINLILDGYQRRTGAWHEMEPRSVA
jgi:peptide/nickel transport system permease protein